MRDDFRYLGCRHTIFEREVKHRRKLYMPIFRDYRGNRHDASIAWQ
jgi:hypothetical protein